MSPKKSNVKRAMVVKKLEYCGSNGNKAPDKGKAPVGVKNLLGTMRYHRLVWRGTRGD